MNINSLSSLCRIVNPHAPGFIIALYFLSLQFVASINLSYLILLAGFLFLLSTQSTVRWGAMVSGASLIALLLISSTVISTRLADHAVVNPAIAISQLPGLLVFLMVVLFIRDEEQLGCIVGSLLIVLSLTVWHFFQASYRADFARGIALIFHAAHPMYLAANDVLMLSIFLPLVVWFGRKLTGSIGRFFIVVYVVLLGLLSVLLLSRISLVIIALSLTCYFSANRQWWRMWPALILLIAIIWAIYYSDAGFAEKLQSLDLTRLRVWVVAWQMFIDAPWLGHGPGSYSVLYSHYLARIDLALQYGHEGRNIGWAHNLFFEAAAEKGLFGVFTTLLYFIYLIAALRRKLKYEPSELGRALALSVGMCLIAACVELSMLRVWGIYIVYLQLGLVAVFAAPIKKETRSIAAAR